MVPAKKQQEKEEIPENAKSSGSVTIMSWNEILRSIVRNRVSPNKICCIVAEQSPLKFSKKTPRGLLLKADHWGAASTWTAGKKIKIHESTLAWDSDEKTAKHCRSWQREETVAFLLWSVKREIRWCLIPVWKNRISVSMAVIFARNLRYQNAIWQLEKQCRTKKKRWPKRTLKKHSNTSACVGLLRNSKALYSLLTYSFKPVYPKWVISMCLTKYHTLDNFLVKNVQVWHIHN